MDINDSLPAGIELLKYADDILAYILGHLIYTDLPQKIADAVDTWLTKNEMKLNTTKCKVIIVQSKEAILQPPTIQLNSQPLDVVSSYKYLGVEINNKLDLDQKWLIVQSKTRSIPYLVKRLKFMGFKQELLVNVYRALALSHFNYSPSLKRSIREVKEK